MAKEKFSKALWQEWKQNPQATAQQWGIDWAEWERSVGKQNWKDISYEEFEKLIKKSRWSGLWDWTP